MNKKAIAETALCRYNADESCYVVESPIFERVLGVSDTEEEAWLLFREALDETYIAYLEGKLIGYEKRGRPSKGNVDFHAQVKPEVKDLISERAKELGISQGEVITYFAKVEQVKNERERQVRMIDGLKESQKPKKPKPAKGKVSYK